MVLELKMRNGQSGLEFVTLMGVSVAFLIGMVAVIGQVTTEQQHENTFQELQDLARSLQNEFLLANEVEDGYVRAVRVPEMVNNREFMLDVSKQENVSAALEFEYEGRVITYLTPYFEGDLQKGANTIRKRGDVLHVE